MRKVLKQIPVPMFRTKVFDRLTAAQALRSVTSKSGLGVYANSDKLFRGAIIGRDALEVADDLMVLRRKLVERILLTLGSLQGEEANSDSEEEPGKIIYEYRSRGPEQQIIDQVSQDILKKLSERWGGTSAQLAYFGAVDTTPMFIRVLYWYCNVHGDEILTKKVKLRSGHVLSMTIVADNAADWLMKKLSESKSGLLEFKSTNDKGLKNQTWKNSKDSLVHADGSPVNFEAPVSTIELQGLAYDALRGAAKLLPNRAGELLEMADKLRNRTIDLLWMPKTQYFGLGTDFDENGKLRVIKTRSANPGALLDTAFFDHFPDKEKRKYVEGIAKTVMSLDFLTDAGIRSLALSARELTDEWDSHGAFSSWPKETYDISKGLKRQGLPHLAFELENRLLNVIRAVAAYPEFFYVDAQGRLLGIPNRRHTHGDVDFDDLHEESETVQAWTISAIIGINAALRARRLSKGKIEGWRYDLEKKILDFVPHAPLLNSARQLSEHYPFYPNRLSKEQLVQ